ncbi:MAG TPA: hypothetical protein VGO05_05260 [Roseiarcus sp.]|nr:hypothetical protein [Roseiarcus sp.]
MAILIFILSLILLAAAAASGYESLDLLPTSTGVLYALAGAVAACGAVVTFAIGVLTSRIGALTKLVRESAGRSALPIALEAATSAGTASAETVSAAPSAIETEFPASRDEAAGAEDESPINFNRSGHLPSLETIETALETPEEPQGPPTLIGSYSSAGANYKIFSDGSIEAETGEGTFQFASMGDFKHHLSETKAKTASTSE